MNNFFVKNKFLKILTSFFVFFFFVFSFLNPNNKVEANATLQDAIDYTATPLTLGGSANWYRQTAITNDGVDAARSGLTPDNQQSFFQTTVTGPGTLTFMWRVSSEQFFDNLLFCVTATCTLSVKESMISGETAWALRTVAIPSGSVLLTWKYMKDSSFSSGSDAGFVDQVSFVPSNPSSSPIVTTSSVTNLAQTSATSGGTITSNGGSTITTSGIVWGATTNPTIALSTKTTNGPSSGSWSHNMTSLTCGTTYHVRAYATNAIGTGYGSNTTFTTSACPLPEINTIQDFSFRFPPINLGAFLQRKSGGLIVNGLRSTNYTRLDSVIQIPTNAGTGKVLTSDAVGNATWEPLITGPDESHIWTRDTSTSVVRLTNNNDKVGLGLTNPTEQLEITNNFRLPNTTGATTGVIYKGSTRFIHDMNGTNMFFGKNAGNFNLDEYRVHNIAIGSGALTTLNRSYNIALGYNALNSGTYNDFNIGIGSNSVGSDFGHFYVVGANSSASNTSGVSVLGYNSSTNISGSFIVGNNSSINEPYYSSGSYIIGNNVNVNTEVYYRFFVFGNPTMVGWGLGTQAGTNAFRVGTTTSNGNGARLTTTGTWTSTSDLNKKTNIKNLSYGLKDVLKLRPVNFDWKESKQGDIGFIAQEVKKVIPELVNGQEGDLALSYANMTTVLTRAIQEQNEEIENDKNNFSDFEIQLKKIEQNIKSKINE